MADIQAIIGYYIRRNLRLRERGVQVPSFRDSAFSRCDAKGKSKVSSEIKKLVDEKKAKWVTIRGAKVCIENGSNKILAGPESFVGKTPSEALGISWGKTSDETKEEPAPKEEPKEEKPADKPAEKPSPEKLREDRVERGKITGQQLAEIQKNLKISETGANESCGGFRVYRGIDGQQKHHEKHGSEPDFKDMTPEEYGEATVEFLKQPCGGNIVGGTVQEPFDGVMVTAVIRYDKEKGLYAKGYPGGFAMTFMKAKYTVERVVDGRVVNEYNPNWKEDGYRYFLRTLGNPRRSS